MSREIKFRAWVGRMVQLDGLDFQQTPVGMRGRVHGDPDRLISGGGVVFMQFTGLKDKNGKEIYEGDVVKCLDGYNATVSRDEKHTGFAPFGDGEGAEWDKGVEVIGNIYENPELIKP